MTIGRVSEDVTVSASEAARSAPSQPLLSARSAQSQVSEEFIRNNTSPTADFSQVLQAVPGMFSYSSNGPGLSDTKTFFRGFKDGQYNIAFDGIPFYANDRHHSWTFFPTQFLGGAVVDRSPGSAASIGPTTFGGSVNLQSAICRSATSSRRGPMDLFGTSCWVVSTIGGKAQFCQRADSSRTDGYQTYNGLQRDSVSGSTRSRHRRARRSRCSPIRGWSATRRTG